MYKILREKKNRKISSTSYCNKLQKTKLVFLQVLTNDISDRRN